MIIIKLDEKPNWWIQSWPIYRGLAVKKCYVRLGGSFKKKYGKMKIFFSHRKDLCMSVAYEKTCQVKLWERSDGGKRFWRMQESGKFIIGKEPKTFFFLKHWRGAKKRKDIRNTGLFWNGGKGSNRNFH